MMKRMSLLLSCRPASPRAKGTRASVYNYFAKASFAMCVSVSDLPGVNVPRPGKQNEHLICKIPLNMGQLWCVPPAPMWSRYV